MEWLDQHFREVDNFPRPDWGEIYQVVDDKHKDADQDSLWCDIARAWMGKVISKLPGGYSLHESENFIVVSNEEDKYNSLLLSFLERTLSRILSTLKGIASDDGYGKYIVIVFNDIDDYYAYLSYFYDEGGVYGLSSGVYLNRGYGHFAFPYQELAYAESIASHEMTHALVAHLPIPAWLNEGMAVTIEDMITGSSPLRMDNEQFSRHRAFWGSEEIQQFWSGEAFHRPDEGQELSYHLAQFAVNALSKDYEAFIAFTNSASHEDGGEAAAQDVFGSSLGGLIEQFFGDGEWAPAPNTWSKESSNNARNSDGFAAGSLKR